LAQNLQAWLHATYPNVALAGNLSWCDCYLTDELNLLSHLDIWFDEQGMTAGNNGAQGYSGQAWRDKVAAVESVVNAGHGWQDINQEPVSFANTTAAQRQWALANYLLLKSNASWIYICGQGEYHSLLIAPEYAAAQVGTPTDSYYASQSVYRRDFTTGLTLVNPSASTTYTIAIPANTYRDLYGNIEGGSVTLGPESGIVLVDANGNTVSTTADPAAAPSVSQTSTRPTTLTASTGRPARKRSTCTAARVSGSSSSKRSRRCRLHLASSRRDKRLASIARLRKGAKHVRRRRHARAMSRARRLGVRRR
jgi:hypothetical protein